jgi:hypothetical protein
MSERHETRTKAGGTKRGREAVARAVAGVLVFAAAFGPAQARADGPAATAPSPEAIAQARPHFTRGVKLYEEGDFRAALIEFNRAYTLAPNWAVLYNVGQSYYQLRDYANALGTLSTYEAQGGPDIPATRRVEVDREIEELRSRSAHVAITSNTNGVNVTVDDLEMGQTPLAAPELVGEGRHTFRATKAGYAPVSQVVDIAGGDNIKVSLDLAPPLTSSAAPGSTASPSAEHAASYAPAIVSLGVGGAGLALGAVFGILAVGEKSSLKSACQGTVCPASAQADINAFTRDGAISTVSFVVGGVGVAAAAVLYLTERPHRERAGVAGVELHPWFAGSSGGVTGAW